MVLVRRVALEWRAGDVNPPVTARALTASFATGAYRDRTPSRHRRSNHQSTLIIQYEFAPSAIASDRTEITVWLLRKPFSDASPET